MDPKNVSVGDLIEVKQKQGCREEVYVVTGASCVGGGYAIYGIHVPNIHEVRQKGFLEGDADGVDLLASDDSPAANIKLLDARIKVIQPNR